MPATIVERTIGGFTEKGIQLNNAQICRPVTMPVGWTTMRIGIRMQMTSTGAALQATPIFYIGFGSGTTNLVGDQSTTNFIGITVLTADMDWGWDVNKYQLNATNGVISVTKVGSTITKGATGITTGFYMSNKALTAGADRNVFMVDVTKGAPNYTVNFLRRNLSTTSDISDWAFAEQMPIASPTVNGHAFGTARTIAFDEVAGALNNVQVYWNRNDAFWEIYDLSVTQIA